MGHHTDQTDGSSRSNSISDENIQSLINLLNSSDETDSKSLKKRIPVEADILISYATTPGIF